MTTENRTSRKITEAFQNARPDRRVSLRVLRLSAARPNLESAVTRQSTVARYFVRALASSPPFPFRLSAVVVIANLVNLSRNRTRNFWNVCLRLPAWPRLAFKPYDATRFWN